MSFPQSERDDPWVPQSEQLRKAKDAINKSKRKQKIIRFSVVVRLGECWWLSARMPLSIPICSSRIAPKNPHV